MYSVVHTLRGKVNKLEFTPVLCPVSFGLFFVFAVVGRSGRIPVAVVAVVAVPVDRLPC